MTKGNPFDLGELDVVSVVSVDINGIAWDAPWETACRFYRGRVLTGPLCHYCWDWDGLPIEFGDEEMAACTCFAGQEIAQLIGNWSA